MNDNKHNNNNGGKTLSRRTFLKALGLGTLMSMVMVRSTLLMST